jgi:hypothetical protein
MFFVIENGGRQIPLSDIPFAVSADGLPILARKSANVLQK